MKFEMLNMIKCCGLK